ncbi:MAG: MBL fold metallo-hydrolase [Hyphomicrobiaceae bacterium]
MTKLTFNTEMVFAYGVPAEVAPGVQRLVANNPSVFTHKGTNTYIVGHDTLAIVDPGPEDASHHAALIRAIAGRPVSHIVITHTHRDHTDGLAALVRATGAKVAGYGRTAANPGVLKIGPSGGEFVDADFRPDVVLRDGDRIETGGFALEAIFTPGHAPDHLCLALVGTGVLFSGDHIMGWNTTVVAPPEGDMGDYYASLDKLIARADTDLVYLPGHGGEIAEPHRVARAYLVHRRWREQAILAAIRDGKPTIEAIVALIYDQIDQRLVKAASLSVQAHVEHLIRQRLVACDGPVGFASALRAL